VAVQSDRRIVVVGEAHSDALSGGIDFAIARFLPDGDALPSYSGLDPTFGTNGQILLDFSRGDAATSIAIQPDNKILVAGYSYADSNPYSCTFAITRLMPDRTADPSFGTVGRVQLPIGHHQPGYPDICASRSPAGREDSSRGERRSAQAHLDMLPSLLRA
jgi:uncharacterized delta-60 repeat protein